MKATLCVFILAFLMTVSVVNLRYIKAAIVVDMRVHNIDTGLDYETVQGAIDANETLDGHTILVDAGLYYERVFVYKSLSIVGENKSDTIIDGQGLGTVVNVMADDVSISGLTIRNGGFAFERSGIFLNSSRVSDVSDNIVMNNVYGIRLSICDHIVVSGNIIVNNSYGLWLSQSQNNVVSGNNISESIYAGIHLFPSSNNIVSENTVSDNEHGIYVYFSRNNTIVDNIAFNNSFGIWSSGSQVNRICNNKVFDNNKSGIWLGGSFKNVLVENTLINNDVGVSIRDSVNNSIFHNNFVNNNVSVRTVDSANTFDNGSEGNFWSDYDGADLDEDSVGDSPRVIDQNNTDNFPLMGMFSGFSVTLEDRMFDVFTVCNSTLSDFTFNYTWSMIEFKVEGFNNSVGFCRATIPKQVVNAPYIVLLDSMEVNATLLPASNLTHTLLYFTYRLSTRQVLIASKPYYELATLLHRYNVLLANYTELVGEFEALSTLHTEVVLNYSSLQVAYNDLNETYHELKGRQDATEKELGDVRGLMNIFVAATIFGASASVVFLWFGFMYYRRFNKQKKIFGEYKFGPLELGQFLFEMDIRRREGKIKRFEQKYGFRVQPRSSLDEIIRSLKSRKKEKRG